MIGKYTVLVLFLFAFVSFYTAGAELKKASDEDRLADPLAVQKVQIDFWAGIILLAIFLTACVGGS